MTPQCVGICLQLSTPLQIQGRACSFFSQKVPPILGVHFQSAGGCGGAAAPPLAYVLSIPGLFAFAALVSPCLPVRVPRVLCCVGAISATSHVRCTKSHGKKDCKDPIQDRGRIHTCSPIATPRPVAGPQVWRSAAWQVSLRGLWLRAHERRCSWRLRASTSSMRDERCCVHGEVCAPRYVLFLVAPIGARVLAGGLICCSIWAIHALSRPRGRPPISFGSAPTALDKASCRVVRLRAVPCLACCLCAFCRSPLVFCRLQPTSTWADQLSLRMKAPKAP